MNRPVLFTLDDNAEVLKAVGRDLRVQYGESYRVVESVSAASGLEALQTLKRRDEPVALFLVDQRMPEMSGVEFLQQARDLFPDAKRVLLTAYAETEAAIDAINRAQVDFYLLKPWSPPEEKLYPILDDLLEEWQAGYRPPFAGMRIVGHRWSPETHRLKDFLARNLVPYQWFDLESQPKAARLLEETGLAGATLPVVLFPDGEPVSGATIPVIAERVGLRTRAERPFYDFIIVGGGPAGLAAAVYGACEGLRTMMVEKEAPGGQAGQSSRIENYLGFPAGLSGAELARRATAQARRFGAEILAPQEVAKMEIDGPYRKLRFGDGSEVSCHALLIATGVDYRRHPGPGMERLTGAGVYYGASMTEAAAYRDQEVFVVGGGNSAGQAAMHFSRYASKVTVLVRGDDLRAKMSRYLVDRIEAAPNIELRTRTEIVDAEGTEYLKSVTLRGLGDGRTETVPASGLFLFIGAVPNTDWLESNFARDPQGFLLTGPDLSPEGGRPRGWPLDRDPFLLETNVPGVFAAGDVRLGSMKRVAAGVGEGSTVVSFVHRYLAEL